MPTRSLVTVLLALVVSAAAAGMPAGEGLPAIHEIGDVEVVTPGCGALPCRPVYTVAEIRKWLEPLVGKPFDRSRIARRIERRYASLGYEPGIAVTLAGETLRVRVVEAPAMVAEVVADPDFLRAYVPSGLLEELEPITRPHVPLRSVRTQSGDLANRDRLARDRYDLSRLGYDIVPIPVEEGEGPGRERYVITRRPPLRRWKEVMAADQEEAPAGSKSGPSREGRPPLEPLRKRWISAGVSYSRRDRVTARLFYKRAHLFREFDLIEISPYVSRELAGAIRYSQPYILPASVTSWNLFGATRLYKEFTPDRVFGPVKIDEVRIGGGAALGLEPFRHRNGHSLKGWVYLDRYHVDFGEFAIPIADVHTFQRSTQVPGAELNDIAILGVKGEYAYRHLFRAPRAWWRFLPELEVASKSLGGDVSFRRIYGELHQHYAFSSGIEIDMRWKGGVVTGKAPLFEQFALGGAGSLRGFLRDDFHGRRLLAAQNDLWIPLPFTAAGRDSRLLAALQRNLKTALIFDVGSISFEDVLDVRLARGIGIGFVYSAERSPLVIRADVSWGYWEGVTSWYPYFAITRKW
jgi:hypothetical protein